MGIKNPFKEMEKKIKRGIDSLGNDIKRGINNLGNDVKNGVNKVGNDVRNGVQQAGNEVERELKGVAHRAESELKSTFNELEDELEETAEKIFEAAKDEALSLAQAAMKEISRGAINKVVDAAQVVLPTSVDLSLGPIGLNIGDMTGRIDTLQKWASNPPSSRNDIRQIITEVAPTSVSINLNFSLAFLFVQSDSLEFGVTASYETEDFLNKMDEILGRFGIKI